MNYDLVGGEIGCVCEPAYCQNSNLKLYITEKRMYVATAVCIVTMSFPTGSCVNAGFTSCCDPANETAECGQGECFCDQMCHTLGDCCFDIEAINCFPRKLYII